MGVKAVCVLVIINNCPHPCDAPCQPLGTVYPVSSSKREDHEAVHMRTHTHTPYSTECLGEVGEPGLAPASPSQSQNSWQLPLGVFLIHEFLLYAWPGSYGKHS